MFCEAQSLGFGLFYRKKKEVAQVSLELRTQMSSCADLRTWEPPGTLHSGVVRPAALWLAGKSPTDSDLRRDSQSQVTWPLLPPGVLTSTGGDLAAISRNGSFVVSPSWVTTSMALAELPGQVQVLSWIVNDCGKPSTTPHSLPLGNGAVILGHSLHAVALDSPGSSTLDVGVAGSAEARLGEPPVASHPISKSKEIQWSCYLSGLFLTLDSISPGPHPQYSEV